MGIRGLGAFLDQHDGFERFDDAAQASIESNCNPSLVIDGLSLCHYLRNRTKLFPNTGYISCFADAARTFVNRLFACGISRVIVVFDGCHEPIKHDTRRERRSRRWEAMAALIKEIKQETASAPRDLTSITLYRMAFIYVLQQLGDERAQIIVGAGEADRLAAQICRSGNHFAVLAEDSDYLLMNIRYFPLTSLYMDEEIEGATLHGKIFTPERISKVLGIPLKMYGAFACLCGNDYVHGGDLEKILSKLSIPMKLSPSALIKKVLGMIKSGELKEEKLVLLLEGAGSRRATALSQKYKLSCSMYDPEGEPALQPEQWMQKTEHSAAFAERFVSGSIHPAIMGVFTSKTYWLAIHPHDRQDSRIYDVWQPLRTRNYGMMCAIFGSFAPGTVFQEEGANDKVRKISPIFDAVNELDGSQYSAKEIMATLPLDEAALERREVFCKMCIGLLPTDISTLDDNIVLLCIAISIIRRRDAQMLSEDEITHLLVHSYSLLDSEAFNFARERLETETTRRTKTVREVHVTSLILLGLEQLIVANQLCGNPLTVKMVRLNSTQAEK